jgi:hypothetical protein
MALDKAIASGKEHRKPYYKSARHDKTCRPGGGCSWCRGNRTHTNAVRLLKAGEPTDDPGRGD